MSITTRRILVDMDGRPISQYYNPRLVAYDAVHGDHGRMGVTASSLMVLTVESTAVLAANATFTGPTRDLLLTPRCSQLRATVFASHAGTLIIEQARAAAGPWRIPADTSVAIAAGECRTLTVPVVAQFWRIRYVNGAIAQTEFDLWSVEVGV